MYGREYQRDADAYGPPQIEIQLPKALPRLQQLRFGGYRDWDALHQALWPLAVLAAVSASERAAGCGAATVCSTGSPPQAGGIPTGAQPDAS